jgi:hypothetical protein
MLLFLAGPVVVLGAYLAGRHSRRKGTIPWRPIFQLVDHRTRCLGQDRPRVQRELGLLLHVPPWAWDEIFAMRKLFSRRGVPARKIEMTRAS